MGLFSSSKEIYVGTSVVPLISNEALLPNPGVMGTVRSILGAPNNSTRTMTLLDVETNSIPELIVEEIVNGLGPRCTRMANWADANYVHGVPGASLHHQNSLTEAIIEEIRKDRLSEQEGLYVPYLLVGKWNWYYATWYALITTFEYRDLYNFFSLPTSLYGDDGFGQKIQAQLVDFQLILPVSMQTNYEPTAIEAWGPRPTAGVTPERPNPDKSVTSFTPPRYSNTYSSTEVHAQIWWERTDPANPTNTIAGSFVISCPKIATQPATREYVMYFCSWILIGDTRVFSHDHFIPGSGTYPAVDALLAEQAYQAGNFMPVIHFRNAGTDLSVNKTTEHYRDSVKACKILGLDYQFLADQINANPDSGQLEQAMLTFSVPMNTTSQIGRRYLFDFFDDLYSLHPWFRDFLARPDSEMEDLEPLIRQSLQMGHVYLVQDKLFKQGQRFDAIFKAHRGGTVCEVGDYDVVFTEKKAYIKQVQVTGWEYIDPEYPPLGTHVVTRDKPLVWFRPTWSIRHQVSKNTYIEIDVVNPWTTYHIYGDYRTTGNTENPQLIFIPISRGVVANYSLKDREQLFARSMHFVFNSKVEYYVKWYQQDWFFLVTIVVAVAVTVYSFGQASGPVSALFSATSTAAATAALVVLINKILVAAVISYGMKILAKEVGVDVVIVLAAVLAAYAGYQYLAQTSTATTASTTAAAQQAAQASISLVPTSSGLLNMSTGLIRAAGSEVERQMGELSAEAERFAEESEEKLERLTAAQNELGLGTTTSSQDQTRRFTPFVLFGESPDQFFRRTVHAGNIGTVGLDAITLYVDTALRLPNLTDTLGDLS